MQTPRRSSPDTQRHSRDRAGVSNPGTVLYVNNLSLDLTEDQLKQHLTSDGLAPSDIERIAIMMDPHTKESRGFAFVTMTSTEVAQEAIEKMNGTELEGKTISVEMVRSRSERKRRE